jgi:hypothetical protein
MEFMSMRIADGWLCPGLNLRLVAARFGIAGRAVSTHESASAFCWPLAVAWLSGDVSGQANGR